MARGRKRLTEEVKRERLIARLEKRLAELKNPILKEATPGAETIEKATE